MTYSSSEQLFQMVINSTDFDERLKKSFIRIKAACDSLEDEVKKSSQKGVLFQKNPIYVTSVGNKCVVLFGGPSPASIIQNKKKEPLKTTYINLRAAELKLPGKNQKSLDPIDSIQDQNLKSYIKSLETKTKILEARLLALSKLIKNNDPQPISSVLEHFSDQKVIVDNHEISNFTKPLNSKLTLVINKILDSNHLNQFNLVISSDYIVDQTTGLEFLTNDDVKELKLISN